MFLIEWFLKGGIFMWPLLLCSLLALATVIDRLILHTQIKLDFEFFISKLKADILSHKTLFLPEWVTGLKAPTAKLVAIYFNYLDSLENVRNEALKREGNRLLAHLDNRMRLLSVIANVAPLLGLLGTVAGLVTAFHTIEAKGGVIQPGDLAGGIWAALITTVTGLSIGIPSLLFHNYFQGKNQLIARQMEETISELDEIIAESHLADKPSEIGDTAKATKFKTSNVAG